MHPHRLEIDAGNSAVKWRLRAAGATLAAGRVAHADFAQCMAALAQEQNLGDCAWAVSVAGAAIEQKIRDALREVGVPQVKFAQVARQRAGVRCAYEDLSCLGPDRWLAVLAAATEHAGPLLVVDCGTALTLDLVSADKQHCGGFILPGWALLAAALQRGTAIPTAHIPADFAPLAIAPGCSTNDAVGMGRLLGLTAAIEQAAQQHRQREQAEVRIIMTGGDAERLRSLLRGDTVFRPDLVLDGLAIALG
ncbi:MAG: type III pantothenate kinase [Cellvibrionales bacterium]|nr:type III pantothenate kinase [Cellvibrionales bacterium]